MDVHLYKKRSNKKDFQTKWGLHLPRKVFEIPFYAKINKYEEEEEEESTSSTIDQPTMLHACLLLVTIHTLFQWANNTKGLQSYLGKPTGHQIQPNQASHPQFKDTLQRMYRRSIDSWNGWTTSPRHTAPCLSMDEEKINRLGKLLNHESTRGRSIFSLHLSISSAFGFLALNYF